MPCTGTVALKKSVYKINFIVYVNCSKNFKQNNHLHKKESHYYDTLLYISISCNDFFYCS